MLVKNRVKALTSEQPRICGGRRRTHRAPASLDDVSRAIAERLAHQSLSRPSL
jgi:hypothetical protein